MTKVIDGTKVASHGLFYMENAGGRNVGLEQGEIGLFTAADEHRPSCFAFEEERGEEWKGSGATTVALNEARPSL